MKKAFARPMFTVEYYTLIPSSISYNGDEIAFTNADCAEKASVSTGTVQDRVSAGSFLSATASTKGCTVDPSCFTKGRVKNMLCSFTGINAAFTF